MYTQNKIFCLRVLISYKESQWGSTEVGKSYSVVNDRIFILGWTGPLIRIRKTDGYASEFWLNIFKAL